MASSIRLCTVKKCKLSSCAVCHCCQNDLCLDHLKEHKDQLNTEFIPLTNRLDSIFDSLEHSIPTSSPNFKLLEQWRIDAHKTIDRFYERIRLELCGKMKDKPLRKLNVARNTLQQLIQIQGATRENIASLTSDIQSIEQEINNLQNIQINLRPLVIDDDNIFQPDSSTKSKKSSSSTRSQTASQNESFRKNTASKTGMTGTSEELEFQIFVQLPTGQNTFLSVNPFDTMLQLKNKILDKHGIPVGQQYLTFLGKILRDDFTVAMIGIQKHYTINLRLLMRQTEKTDTPS